jgi:hypothetical protein
MADGGGAPAEKLRLHLLVLRCQTGDERAFASFSRSSDPARSDTFGGW